MTNSIGDIVAANMAEIIESDLHRNIFKKASLTEKVAKECNEDEEDCSYAKDGKHLHKKKQKQKEDEDEDEDEDKDEKKKKAHNVNYLFEKQSFDQVMIGLMKLSQHLENQGFTRTAGESLKLAEMLMAEAKFKAKFKAKKKAKEDMCKWCDCDPCECKSKKDKNKEKDKDMKKKEDKRKEDMKKKK